MKRAWAVGLEDIDGQQVDVSELEVPASTVEAQLVEVQGQDAEIDALVSDGDELARDTDALEATADVVADAAEDGGMDESAARVVDVAVEHFCERWDIKRTKVAAENFGSNRVQATKVALESIMDAVKDAWSTFVTWLTELLAKLKDWWLKYVNAGKAMKDRADKLEDRLDSLGAKNKDKIKGGWLKDLYVDNVASVDAVITAAANVGKETKVAIQAVDGKLTEAGKFVRSEGTDKKVVEFGKKTQKKFDSLIPSGASEVAVSAVPGNGYWITFKKNGVSEARFQVFPVADGTKELDTPDAGKMKTACGAIVKIGDALETNLKDFRTVNENLTKLKDAAKKAAEELKEATGDKANTRDDKKSALKSARAAVNEALAIQKCVTHSMKSAGAGLIGYVTAGIAAHKKAG